MSHTTASRYNLVFVHWHFNWFCAVITLRWRRCNARHNHFRTECHNNTLYVCVCFTPVLCYCAAQCANANANARTSPRRQIESANIRSANLVWMCLRVAASLRHAVDVASQKYTRILWTEPYSVESGCARVMQCCGTD